MAPCYRTEPLREGCLPSRLASSTKGLIHQRTRDDVQDKQRPLRTPEYRETVRRLLAGALPNNNSSIQFARLDNGHLALVFNDISAAQVSERRVSSYDDTPSEPEIGQIEAILELARTHACALVIGSGGGSAMDVAVVLNN